MSFLKHLLRNWMGGGYYGGHHGGPRYGHGYGRGGYYGPGPQGPAPPAVVCPQCGAENPPGTRFCAQCGAPLAGARCASCKAEIPAGAKFCPQCGQPSRSSG
mgnify:CR=1 FL=1